ncbi:MULTISPECIES: sugar phosphate isomerase/epimerase family protein [Brachybacterium]|uniref:Sugar phosphate isomerase/epimerase n=1 Tax=Brachybacterium kimchii TaxID=2942909 RepID=A0ABY4NAS8_9MICO|nr:sugar phosphate isomerase/epimerase [Brachybacterium kimchii]UQN30385.1 sugar phosphate isomerase/epimerase [Brachybacterium kimchii]
MPQRSRPSTRHSTLHQRAPRKPITRSNQARDGARDDLTRRLSAGAPLSEQEPQRRIPVGLSTSSVFPLGVEDCFRLASHIGYDGVEVMVSVDRASRDAALLRDFAREYDQPILSLHAPTLFFLQFVWGRDPWVKLERTVQMAVDVDCPTVVAHPPFRWQGSYAREFVEGVKNLEAEYGIAIAVENMYPWRLGVREAMVYLPDHDPTDEEYDHVTVDLSHAATAGDDALAMVDRLGDRLAHLHLADGTGRTTKDEHLPPGEGNQPCAEVLRRLANRGWEGSVLLEISTRGGHGRPTHREDLLRQSLLFARYHLGHHLDERLLRSGRGHLGPEADAPHRMQDQDTAAAGPGADASGGGSGGDGPGSRRP